MGYIFCLFLCLDSWSSLTERHFIWQHFGMVPPERPRHEIRILFLNSSLAILRRPAFSKTLSQHCARDSLPIVITPTPQNWTSSISQDYLLDYLVSQLRTKITGFDTELQGQICLVTWQSKEVCWPAPNRLLARHPEEIKAKQNYSLYQYTLEGKKRWSSFFI